MLEMGIERVLPTLRTVCYVEVEAFAQFNLVAAMEAGIVAPAPIWPDIKTFPSGPFHGKIHGLVGGYPCQPFSSAGKRLGADDPRHLWPHFERHIRAIRPVWCFFENVEGHLSLGFKEVLESLCKLGYTVEAGVFSAASLGAPQVRERLFILAVLDARGLWNGLGNAHGYAVRPQPKQLGRNSPQFGQGGEPMGNANSERQVLPMRIQSTLSELGGNGTAILSNPSSKRSGQMRQIRPPKQLNQDGLKWPAPPGHAQYAWEAPRVAQSGLGVSANGYNFRSHILRLLGNGVVPPVAASAFYELAWKQAKNFGLI